MSIEPGQQLLHYRLVEKIGEGGMGAVWRATDTALGRDVAIKLLPRIFSETPERLARFEREARVLAALNHPNIAAIYGLHQAGEERFLAMELVEGEDLSKRLERGPLSVDQALNVAAQMAAGMEAAHEKGIVHRDLKPANVIVTPEGNLKLLDFGLAKAFENDPASGDPSLSPTMTSAGTVAGMILGTAAYMSPEQARGKPLDRRTDMWSFGCVLYECLVGSTLFGGETVSDSLAAILRKDPDWSKLPDETPPMVRLLLRRCLTRDPAKRLRDAGGARLELEQAIEDPSIEALGLASAGVAPVAQPRSFLRSLPWLLTGAVALLATFFALRQGSPSQDSSTARRLMIPVPNATQSMFQDGGGVSPPAASPDGRFVVFGRTDDDGVSRLWLRPFDNFEPRALPGTEGANYAFWSPDSRHIGFYRGGRLKRIEMSSGRIQPVGGEGAFIPRGASWGTNGQILFAPNSNTGIWIIDAAGGEARQLTAPDPDIADASHRWPHFLPDGDHYLYLLWTNNLTALEQYGGVYLASISGDTEPVRLVANTSSMAYAPPGYLLVVQEENLMAIPFDATQGELSGAASVIAGDVQFSNNSGYAAFSVSAEGTLVYAQGDTTTPPATFVWYDRDGNRSAASIEPTPLMGWLRLSSDATRAISIMPSATGDGELWLIDLLRGVRTRLSPVAPFAYRTPVLSADGERVLYISPANGTWDLYLRNADGSGTEQPFLQDDADKVLYDWSRDGNRALYWPAGAHSRSSDLWIYDSRTQQSEVLIEGAPSFTEARFSPDGRHVTYMADDSGRMEVFLQAIDGGARSQVSTGGGSFPHWRDDGREIVYLDPDLRVMAVSVDPGTSELTLGRPQELFILDRGALGADAAGDHSRFLFAFTDQQESQPLHVILNWDAGL